MESSEGSRTRNGKIYRGKEGSSVDKNRLIRDLTSQLSKAIENYDHLAEKYQACNVDDKDQRIKELSDQLCESNEKYDRLSERFREFYVSNDFFKAFPAAFLQSSPGEWGPNLRGICEEVMVQWAFNYCLEDIDDMESISDDDKKYIIANLKGYCVQEDFDYLASRFPHAAHYGIPSILIGMYIIKDIVERFHTNPFWYLGPNPAAAMQDEQAKKEQEEFANNLFTVGKRFKEANRDLYEHWRVTTCRLANVHRRDRGQNLEFGESTKEYRETVIRPMVSKILSSKTAQLLSKEPEKINPGDLPYEQLLKIYRRAAQDAVHMSFWDVEPEIHTLDTISSEFDHKSESTRAAVEHFVVHWDPCLDGKRVLGVTVPGLRTHFVERWTNCGPLPEKKVWNLKVYALVEDTGPPRDPYILPECPEEEKVGEEEEG